jgi:transposase-like protein
MEGAKEDRDSWVAFLRHLKGRGLQGVRLFVSDKCLGLVEALAEFYPEASWQRCAVHFYRNVFTAVPKGKVKEVAAMLKAVHAQEDETAAQQKAKQVAEKLEGMRLGKAAGLVRAGIEETLAYLIPSRGSTGAACGATTCSLRLMRERRRRTRVVGCFPDGESALMLVAARLRHVAGTKGGSRRYLEMSHLQDYHGERVDLSVPPQPPAKEVPSAAAAAG